MVLTPGSDTTDNQTKGNRSRPSCCSPSSKCPFLPLPTRATCTSPPPPMRSSVQRARQVPRRHAVPSPCQGMSPTCGLHLSHTSHAPTHTQRPRQVPRRHAARLRRLQRRHPAGAGRLRARAGTCVLARLCISVLACRTGTVQHRSAADALVCDNGWLGGTAHRTSTCHTALIPEGDCSLRVSAFP